MRMCPVGDNCMNLKKVLASALKIVVAKIREPKLP